MPSFTFTSPEGKQYTVDGPQGATKEQAFQMLQQQLGGGSGQQPTATPAPAQQNPSIGQELAAPFQAAASLATNALAPAGAAIENLVTGHTSPQDYAAARAKYAYTPSNPVAQMDINALTAIPRNTIGRLTGYLGGLIGNHSGGLLSSQQAQDALNTGLMAIPGLDTEGDAAAAASRLSPEAQAATNAGLKITPEQANAGLVPRVLQGFSGSAKLERSLSKENAPTVNALSAQEIGAKNLTPAAIRAAKAGPNGIYEAVRGTGSVALNPADFSSVNATGTLQDPAIQALQEHYGNMGSIDANDLVTDLRQLRAHASKNIKAPNAPAQNDLGWAQQHAADALEGALDRHLQSLPNAPVSLQDFRAARQQLAKIHSVESAVRGPNVVPKLLAKQADRGVPLSGNLRTIANAYTNFDRSLQDVTKIRDSGPVNFADLAVGGLAALHNPLLATAMFARPLLRGALASDRFQGSMAGSPLFPGAGAVGLIGRSAPLFNQQQPQGLLR